MKLSHNNSYSIRKNRAPLLNHRYNNIGYTYWIKN